MIDAMLPDNTNMNFFFETTYTTLVAVAFLKPHGMVVGICFCNKTIINANSVAVSYVCVFSSTPPSYLFLAVFK